MEAVNKTSQGRTHAFGTKLPALSADSSLFVGETRPCSMADVPEVVQRSLNINEKLGLFHRSGRTKRHSSHRLDQRRPVPKNGELGLCPGLPEGARLRALGVLGSWVAAFGAGGTFTLQGDAGGFLGAANEGTTITCERMADSRRLSHGRWRSHRFGRVRQRCRSGDDRGHLFIRGAAGAESVAACKTA